MYIYIYQRTSTSPRRTRRSGLNALMRQRTLNPAPEIRSLRTENRNPKTETRTPKPEPRDPKPGIRNPKPYTLEPKP